MITVTNQQLNDFFINANNILQKTAGKQTKMNWAIQRMYDRCLPIVKKFNRKDEDIREAYARTDGEGIFIMNKEGKDFTFTKEKLKEMNAKREELLEEKVEVEEHHLSDAKYIPENYSNLLLKVLSPFVISPDMLNERVYDEPEDEG